MPVKATKKRKKPKIVTQRNACDALWSKIIRSRGYCENCNNRDYTRLHAAHIIGRGRSAHTRTDLANGYCLCVDCHYRFHREPDEWMDFIDRTIGRAEYERLKRKAEHGVGVKFDWFEERRILTAMFAEIKAAA